MGGGGSGDQAYPDRLKRQPSGGSDDVRLEGVGCGLAETAADVALKHRPLHAVLEARLGNTVMRGSAPFLSLLLYLSLLSTPLVF